MVDKIIDAIREKYYEYAKVLWFWWHGYKYSDKTDIRMAIVKKYAHIIDRYVDWYSSTGMTLPTPFELAPGAWTDTLRKIQFSFVSLYEDPEAEITDEIKEGFELFGRYFIYLTDPKYNGESY